MSKTIAVSLLTCVTVAGVAAAQEKAAPRRSDEKPKASQKDDGKPGPGKRMALVKLSFDQEDHALEFARKHHAELANLLEQLRKNSPAAFSRGIREVHLASQRIHRISEKWPGRFDTELEKWKIDSEIRLLAAKWAMSQDPAIEKQIRGLLRARQEAKINDLRADREKLAERMRQLDEQIGMGTAELDAALETEFERLTKQAATAAKDRSDNARSKNLSRSPSGDKKSDTDRKPNNKTRQNTK